jgi:hypothetical protein
MHYYRYVDARRREGVCALAVGLMSIGEWTTQVRVGHRCPHSVTGFHDAC